CSPRGSDMRSEYHAQWSLGYGRSIGNQSYRHGSSANVTPVLLHFGARGRVDVARLSHLDGKLAVAFTIPGSVEPHAVKSAELGRDTAGMPCESGCPPGGWLPGLVPNFDV